MRVPLNALILLVIILATSAPAAPRVAPYLTPPPLALITRLVAPPPARGSTAAHTDFARILELQRHRTREDIARCRAIGEAHVSQLFGAPYGPLTATEARALDPLFDRVRDETDAWVKLAKQLYQRPRPYRTDPRIEPCLPRDTSFAYPSGTAAIGAVYGDLLAHIDPARAAAFRARGEQVGADRVLAGVHHPSDVSAAQELAHEIARRLWESARFRHDLARARASSR